MDFGNLTDIVNTLGFPIAMVGYFIWDKTKTSKQLIETIGQLKDILGHNTVVMEKLLTKLDLEGD